MSAGILDVAVIGGGMITHDLLLPALFHLQRTGLVGELTVCARHATPLQELCRSPELRQAFPGKAFRAVPALETPSDQFDGRLYEGVLAGLRPRQLVVVATPDPLHAEMVLAALKADQHVLCVKPLVQKHAQAVAIAREARARGLLVGVEYHKRYDRRALVARRDYGLGRFGEFAMGDARLIEPYLYRTSNFQNWFTCEQSDPFTYVGCHYVDLVQFITGLRPVTVSVAGFKGRFPNGNEGYLWAQGRVTFANGALLTVSAGLGYPDDGAGSNDQGLTLYCEGDGRTGLIQHNDQFRGVAHSYAEVGGPNTKRYHYINPDFMRYVPWEGAGYRPVGYGFDSVAAILAAVHRIEGETEGRSAADALAGRQKILAEIDATGLIATAANSADNDRVVEAARVSILDGGRTVTLGA